MKSIRVWGRRSRLRLIELRKQSRLWQADLFPEQPTVNRQLVLRSEEVDEDDPGPLDYEMFYINAYFDLKQVTEHGYICSRELIANHISFELLFYM